ncbi:putative gustatory receptor 36a [Musca autumnalis]|uniref:putative gustatory receptor 36a n=1 Tax=Musca autumnalis TaxID=221902 RepID=UPI003CEA674E
MQEGYQQQRPSTIYLPVSIFAKVLMRHLTRWILAFTYYVSQLLGILAFGYDAKTGRVYTSRLLSVYCAIMNAVVCGILPLLFVKLNLSPWNFLQLDFTFKIRILVSCIRMMAILLTIILNWTKREQFMRTLNQLQDMREEFHRQWPLSSKMEYRFERAIVAKFAIGLFANVSIGMESSVVSHLNYEWANKWITLMDFLAIILSVVMTHYYNTISNASVMQLVINVELKEILLKTEMLSYCRGRGIIKPQLFKLQSYKLAKLLDELSVAQYEVGKMVARINAMYDIQGVCVLATIFLNNIVCLYIAYLITGRMSGVTVQGAWTNLFVISTFVSIYVDLLIFRIGLFKPMDYVMETNDLLRDDKRMYLSVDERLEESFKNFSLQLAKFPIEMKLVGLFKFNRAMVFSIFGSTISNAIVLIQYDYKNNYNE